MRHSKLFLVVAAVIIVASAQEEYEGEEPSFDYNSLQPAPLLGPEEFDEFIKKLRDDRGLIVLVLIDDKDSRGADLDMFAASIYAASQGAFSVVRVHKSETKKAWTILGATGSHAVIIIRDGVPRQYGGSLEVLTTHIDRLLAPSVHQITSRKDKTKVLELSTSRVLAYIPTPDKKVEEAFHSCARQFQYAFTFAIVRDTKLARSLRLPTDSTPSIILEHEGQKPIVYEGDHSAMNLMHWVANNRYALFMNMDKENVYEIWSQPTPSVYYFDNLKEGGKLTHNRMLMFRSLAKKYGDTEKLRFVVCDASSFPEVMIPMSIDKVPAVRIASVRGVEHKYESEDLTMEALSEWLDKYLAGLLDSFIKPEEDIKEDVPTVSTRLSPVTLADELIDKTDRHATMLLYDDQADGAAELMINYEQLATQFKDNAEVFISRMVLDEALAAKAFGVDSLPKLFFFGQGHPRSDNVPYSGDYSAASLSEWLTSAIAANKLPEEEPQVDTQIEQKEEL